jgi:hypothetical protein
MQCGRCGRLSNSGRYGGRPTVESALRLDIDDMVQWGGIRSFARLAGEMQFNFYGDQVEVKFESRVGDPWESWLRLKYAMADYWTGEEVEIDDKIFLATTRPPFGGLRWSHAERNPELVALVRQLRRKRPKGGQRSLRDVSAEQNERGQPFSAASINSMLNARLPQPR